MMSILNLADRTEKRRVSVNVARVVGRVPTVMRRRAMSGVTEDEMNDDAMASERQMWALVRMRGAYKYMCTAATESSSSVSKHAVLFQCLVSFGGRPSSIASVQALIT